MQENWKNWFIQSTQGIIDQGGPAFKSIENEGVCAYRSPNGRKCAAGQLIPDELYDPKIEGASWYQGIDPKTKKPFSTKENSWAIHNLHFRMNLSVDDIQFINRLQGCHDSSAPASRFWDEWQFALKVMVKSFPVLRDDEDVNNVLNNIPIEEVKL